MAVDYTVTVPPAAATAEAQQNAEEGLSTAGNVDVSLPLDNGDTQPVSNPVVQRFVTYSYVRTAGNCPTRQCSNVCGARAVAVDDVYTCTENGAGVVLSACAPTLGPVPVTKTECCDAADPTTCIAPAASFTKSTTGSGSDGGAAGAGGADRDPVQEDKTSGATSTAGSGVAAVLYALCILLAIW